MVRSRYYDPVGDAEVEAVLGDGWDVPALVQAVLGLSSGRGHPAAELERKDGSTLGLGTDGEWAVLIWMASLGDSHHSVGEGRGATWSSTTLDRGLKHRATVGYRFSTLSMRWNISPSMERR